MPQRPARGIKYGARAQADLADGINLVARAVSGTLGPHGRVVMMDSRFGTPEISVSAMDTKAGAPVLGNDGYAVAREILTSNPYCNQGVFLARDAGKMAKRTTGDGSTTAIILADAMVRGGLRVVNAGYEPVAVARGMQAAAEQLCALLAARSCPVASTAQLEAVGRQASGDPAIGSAIAEAVQLVGSENVLLEEWGYETGVTIDVNDSFSLRGGYLDSNVIPDRGGGEAVLKNALVFVSSVHVDDVHAFARVLAICAEADRPLLAVAAGFAPDVLAMIAINSVDKRVICIPVVAPGHGFTLGEALEDLAVFAGAQVFGQAGLALSGKAGRPDLGTAGRVVVGRATTTVHDGGADPQKLRLRVATLASEARDAGSLHERDELESRRAQLAGQGFASVRIGAPTDVERRERYRRALDALQAVKQAVFSGVVPGGGAALIRAGAALKASPANGLGDSQSAGFELMRRAVEEPTRVLARNGGWDESEIVGHLRASGERLAFDALNGGYVDGVAAGIVDPTAVVSRAVMVATSTAVIVLRSSVVIVQPLSGGRYAGTAAEGGPANMTLK